jgi:hypothetical protein
LSNGFLVREHSTKTRGFEIEPAHRLGVLAHIVEALGRAGVVVEGDAGQARSMFSAMRLI